MRLDLHLEHVREPVQQVYEPEHQAGLSQVICGLSHAGVVS